MESQDKYIVKWRNIMLSASSALETKDFNLYYQLIDEANKIVDMIKKDEELTYECNNFGMANYVFENALPKLFKSNKNAVKEFISTIKEDKNLLNQFRFYYALNNFNENLDAKEYLNESLTILQENIDTKTLNESNAKLSNIIKKYNLKPSEIISEDKINYFNDCDYLFKSSKKLTNLAIINKMTNNVVKYMTENAKSSNSDKENIINDINNFISKNSSSLNTEEKEFVKDVLNSNIDKRKNVFNKLKNECVEILHNTLKNTIDSDEINELNEIKEQIIKKEFCNETLIKDINKLLEIREVLMS